MIKKCQINISKTDKVKTPLALATYRYWAKFLHSLCQTSWTSVPSTGKLQRVQRWSLKKRTSASVKFITMCLKISLTVASLLVFFLAVKKYWYIGERISLSDQQHHRISMFTNKRDYSRFDGFTVCRKKRYYGSRVLYYSNSHASFQLLHLTISGDINPNPGPELAGKKYSCTICDKNLARNHRMVECTSCCLKFHVKCGKISLKYYTRLKNGEKWVCTSCLFKELPGNACFISNDCLEAGIDDGETCRSEFAETDVASVQEIAKKYIKNCKNWS